jgi:hypothetical protein
MYSNPPATENKSNMVNINHMIDSDNINREASNKGANNINNDLLSKHTKTNNSAPPKVLNENPVFEKINNPNTSSGTSKENGLTKPDIIGPSEVYSSLKYPSRNDNNANNLQAPARELTQIVQSNINDNNVHQYSNQIPNDNNVNAEKSNNNPIPNEAVKTKIPNNQPANNVLNKPGVLESNENPRATDQNGPIDYIINNDLNQFMGREEFAENRLGSNKLIYITDEGQQQTPPDSIPKSAEGEVLKESHSNANSPSLMQNSESSLKGFRDNFPRFEENNIDPGFSKNYIADNRNQQQDHNQPISNNNENLSVNKVSEDLRHIFNNSGEKVKIEPELKIDIKKPKGKKGS